MTASILAVLLGVGAGLVAACGQLEIPVGDYLRTLLLLYERSREAGGRGKRRVPVDREASAAVASEWSMLYLVCVCIALPALIGLVGFLGALLHHGKELRGKVAGAERSWGDALRHAAAKDFLAGRRIDRLLPTWRAVASAYAERAGEPPEGAGEASCDAGSNAGGDAGGDASARAATAVELDPHDLICPICLGTRGESLV